MIIEAVLQPRRIQPLLRVCWRPRPCTGIRTPAQNMASTKKRPAKYIFTYTGYRIDLSPGLGRMHERRLRKCAFASECALVSTHARTRRSAEPEQRPGQVYRTGKVLELPQGLSCLGWRLCQCSTSHRPGRKCARHRKPVYRHAQIHW